MAIVIIGGAGFIGIKFVSHFLRNNEDVLVLDNLCRGKKDYLENLPEKKKLTFINTDVSDFNKVFEIIKKYHSENKINSIWHLAANSDIPAGITDSKIDLKDTFMTTYSLLEVMKIFNIKNLIFSSSSAIYGDHGGDLQLKEDTGPLLPISNYGAMKLASEAIISAATENFLDHAWIFRFPNVIGTPATHGVILDLIRKLKANPEQLAVLGNGTQQKAYLHVNDLIEGMLFIVEKSKEKMNLFNIGPADEGCRVVDIANAVVKRVSPGAKIIFGKENKGWIGDVPKFRYCIENAKNLGWQPKLSSFNAMKYAVDEIAKQEGF